MRELYVTKREEDVNNKIIREDYNCHNNSINNNKLFEVMVMIN